MRNLATACLLLALLSFPGCLITAQDYVVENSEGYYSVRGKVLRIEGLHTSKWQDLKDGWVVVVDHPGCEVTVQQGESKRSRFELQSGDRIIHSHEADHILSALAPNQTEVGTSPPKSPPSKPDPGPEKPPAESDSQPDPK